MKKRSVFKNKDFNTVLEANKIISNYIERLKKLKKKSNKKRML